jgi:hypothetical protein
MKTVYLCGPINGCSDDEATNWREEVKSALGDRFQFLDPMRRDYRGRELEPGIAHEIVSGDKADLEETDIVLAFCPKPSVGTSMEVFLFWEMGGQVVIVHPEPHPSPWLIEHSDRIFTGFDEALSYIQEFSLPRNGQP